MGERIHGDMIADQIKEEIREAIAADMEKGCRRPRLAVLLVGDDARSAVYVRNKQKACDAVGIDCTVEHFPPEATQDELIRRIHKYNENDTVDGIVIQLPLPAHLNDRVIVNEVCPDKDVDGLHDENTVRLYNNDERCLVPATPLGIMKLLEYIDCDVDGKHAVIVGRGRLVGHPLSLLMLNNNATVTVCHSHTRNLTEITKTADILVIGIGKAGFITSEYVREGAVVIDAGINVNDRGKLVGDCDYEGILPVASYITPVPGGVGPMTVAMLLYNVLRAYERRI